MKSSSTSPALKSRRSHFTGFDSVRSRDVRTAIKAHQAWLVSHPDRERCARYLAYTDMNYLTHYELCQQDLSYASFEHSSLTGCKLIGSNLTGCDFTNAELSHTNWLGVTLLGPELLTVGPMNEAVVPQRFLPWLAVHPNFALFKLTVVDEETERGLLEQYAARRQLSQGAPKRVR